jgi:hypothetical protein
MVRSSAKAMASRQANVLRMVGSVIPSNTMAKAPQVLPITISTKVCSATSHACLRYNRIDVDLWNSSRWRNPCRSYPDIMALNLGPCRSVIQNIELIKKRVDKTKGREWTLKDVRVYSFPPRCPDCPQSHC